MENASKALIIAGAILISILIIGLGVVVYNNVSRTIKGANLNTEEAMAQNNKFNQYFGTKVTAADVKALLNAISANNATKDSDEGKPKTIYVTGIESSVTGAYNKIIGGKTYTVNVANDTYSATAASGDGYYDTGFIKTIKITQN